MKERPSPSDDQTVLLIRVNSSTELLNTSQAVDQVRLDFPDARHITLATPQTETRTLLEADRRFSQVLLFPEDGRAEEKSPSSFRRFMAQQRIDVTVVCFGATPGFDYNRHLLSVLLCPGRRYFLDGQSRLFAVSSLRGLRVLSGAALSIGMQKTVVPMLRKLTHRRWKPGRDSLPTENIRRILVIRLDHIGDLVLSLPTIHALKEHFPHAQIDALVGSMSAPLLQDVKDVSEVIVCDTARFRRDGERQSARERFALMRRLRRRHYDLAIDLRGDDTSRLWAVFSGAKRWSGPDSGPYEVPGRINLSLFLTHPLSATETSAGRHASEAGMALVGQLGVCRPEKPYRLETNSERTQAITRRRAEYHIPNNYAVIHVRPGDPAKAWSITAFAVVADHLIQKHDLDVVLSGAKADWETNEQVRSRTINAGRIHNIAGMFPLEEMPALFENARIMVTVDSGPMHIAAAVGTPVVALFLPWTVPTFHPYGQRDGVVTPSDQGLRQLEKTGTLWTGPVLEAISAEEVCDVIDRKLEDIHA